MFLYFAYGSNMDSEDLANWCSRKGYSAIEPVKTQRAILNGHFLSFDFFSRLGRHGGAANITNDRECQVPGILMWLEDREKTKIREKEGPSTYEEIPVSVESEDGVLHHDVLTYRVFPERREHRSVKPTHEYKNIMIKGAEDHRLPKDWICLLKSLPSADHSETPCFFDVDDRFEAYRLTVRDFG